MKILIYEEVSKRLYKIKIPHIGITNFFKIQTINAQRNII